MATVVKTLWRALFGSPGPTPNAYDENTIRVAVVHPHSGSKKMWNYLDKNWSLFGNRPIAVTQFREFTLSTLAQCDPDVIVFSDPAGAPYQYTIQEMNDLVTFITTTHCRHILGTYATFYHQEGSVERPHRYDNRPLAALFGLNPNCTFMTKKVETAPKYKVKKKYRDSLLFTNIGSHYVSYGYNSTQMPSTEGWIVRVSVSNNKYENSDATEKYFTTVRGALSEVNLVAASEDGQCAILHFRTDRYSSLYISHMPEYESTTHMNDPQFLYNCLVFLKSQSPLCSLYGLCLTSIVRKYNEDENAKEEEKAFHSLPSLVRNDVVNDIVLRGRVVPKWASFGSPTVE